MKHKHIYLSWTSFGGGFAVAANAIHLLRENEKIVIDELLYLHDKSLRKSDLAEKDVFFQKESLSESIKKFEDERIIKRIKDCYHLSDFLEKKPKFQNKLLHIKGVTHYQSIFNEVKNYLDTELSERENYTLHINVSPGTPQMHVVWLMLNATGYLPNNTRLWSTQFVRNKNKVELNEIHFKPRTYLSNLFKKSYERGTGFTPDLNKTISSKRKESEEKIMLFSAIPNAPLLLMGERGTGKSSYVNIIHKELGKELPFETLVCGVLSTELMRSELFGYEKGAFTSAEKDKPGILSKFENGGILFLDEIQDLDKSIQRQLLQVLQTGEYRPLGSLKTKTARFKLITATNISFQKITEKLDADFFDRIARFIVEIPPLRKCREDLKFYWENVWEEMTDFEDAPSLIWNKKIQDFLNSDELVGNFRDLQKFATYIIAFKKAKYDTNTSVQKALGELNKWKRNFNTSTNGYFQLGKTHKEINAQFKKDLAHWAVKMYGNYKNAAKVLDRGESTLKEDARGGKK